jgi:hypothetical protein
MIRSILKPEIYHGGNKKPPFFEGWYFKVVDRAENYRFAFIPGVFLHEDPEAQHAFVQVLDGNVGESHFHRYRFTDFSTSKKTLDISVAGNHFNERGMTLSIADGGLSVRGSLSFKDPKPWPVSLRSPGIMGWYAWVPFMECYHGVLSLDHEIEGSLVIKGNEIDFSGGRGYIEKDWGKSFPHAHIWMQSNHFGWSGTSLTASVAIIPWIRSAFPGFIVGLLHQGRLYRFATYTGAETTRLEISDTEIFWTIQDKHHVLTLRGERASGGMLHAPTVTEMSNRLMESLTSSIEVSLTTRNHRTLFSGTGRNSGIEVGGDIESLVTLWKSSA